MNNDLKNECCITAHSFSAILKLIYLFFSRTQLQAFGGLVVGLVTKYAGGVVKGFALIAGRYANSCLLDLTSFC